jgi:hypothetical protein
VEQLASAIFALGKTGIDFEIQETLVGANPIEFDTLNCDNATYLAGLNVHVDQKRLHVLYVDKLKPDWNGYACTRIPPQEGTVVVVSMTAPPNTAAHELGHAFALNAPLPKHGHTGRFVPIHGFAYNNLMWIGNDYDRPLARTHLSLGQAYRMNLDWHSWLIKEFNLSDQKQCQCGPYHSDECPVLYLDVVDISAWAGSQYPICEVDPWNPAP